ncbi:HypC/HybG/HupF family hydrogenase formation chaperone [Collinsella sp. AGMB00827]|uniref:HypC/HybG/HupF family hydrogenase formation chaperone n=1 Tax=Collinsella ureilytica TaxID=2869515 RepID=A0ABS7MK04_9ACTN|nr:HypC/HybG/HupF family hydrogenase formation chaperone [Collinsella urealyticum]MBY4797638.1 HypC/HybG/HupF family hydrogenase formation chaperone [Collinsella urealyticum]
MCLAVPGKIERIDEEHRALVNMMGASRDISLRLVPEAKKGDFVLVHAGFGIQVIDPDEAKATLELLSEMPDMLSDELPDMSASSEPRV